ncbi:MAG: hypothetical protein ABIX28_09905 [Vicinamibacterales bacterium]
MRERLRGGWRRTLPVAAAAALAGCGASPITPERLERAIAPTFANLMHTQVLWLGLTPVAAASFGVSATCRKAVGGSAGSGEWICTLRWTSPEGQALRDVYDLFVTPDGCYAATVEGESLGAPTITALDGRRVRNLLYAFEGCFDKG